MVTFPSGFLGGGLRPKILIKNSAGTLQYTFDSDAGGTQDFVLEGWSLSGGVNSNWGGFAFMIFDPSQNLVDLTDVRRKSKLKHRLIVEVYMKKDSGSYNLWFRGYIEDTTMITVTSVFSRQRVFAIGHGRDMADRQTDKKIYQAKDTDGLTLLTSDTTTRTSEIIKDLIEDTDHLSHKGLSNLGWTVNGVETVDIKLPDFQKFNSSIAQAIEELANISACYYGVDPTGDFFFRKREGSFSGFLVTNSFNSVVAKNWDSGKILYLKRFPSEYNDSILDSGYSIYHAFPVIRHTIDYENTSSNATINLSTLHNSFPITPTTDTISKIALYLTKTGTITKDMIVNIIGTDGSSTPEQLDLRKRVVVSGGRIQRELSSGKYFEISMDNLPVTPLQKIWVNIEKYPDTVNYISIDYQTGTGNYYDSPDNSAWTTRTGNAKIRSYWGKSVRLIGENTVAKKSFGVRETVVPMNDYPDKETALKALGGYMETKGKSRRQYTNIITSVPEDLFDLGKTIRIKDGNTGLDFYSNLIGYQMTSGKGGYADEIVLTIEEWSY
ncbi:baseplate protein [Nitrososphaeria virus YSH_1032793]|uniref:Baseplate protein n=1 Tax=Nitrososphaeria virus YSH_1032793 TaxID=3071320 RepID=A0A976YEV0_9CAUD|nr:baseplate protein [Yangshan Harbor Nitrososphaeria virus]UVF62230.1 baseplate protein [Nitrososphaeria virus YSH_1032793]